MWGSRGALQYTPIDGTPAPQRFSPVQEAGGGVRGVGGPMKPHAPVALP